MTPKTLAEIIDELDPDGEIRKRHATAGNTPAVSVPFTPELSDAERITRARAYLARMPEAVQGQGGSTATYAAAVALVHGFLLSPGEAYALLANDFNPRCAPPWSEAELRHKIDDAGRKSHSQPRGWLLAAGDDRRAEPMQLDPSAAGLFGGSGTKPAPPAPRVPSAPVGQSAPVRSTAVAAHPGNIDNPHRLANGFLAEAGNEHLRSYRDDFIRWADGAYSEVKGNDVKAHLSRWINGEFLAHHALAMQAFAASSDEKAKPPKLNDVTVPLANNVLNAIRSLRHVSSSVESPGWIDGATGPDPKSLIACRNGLYCLTTGQLLPHSPCFLTFTVAPFDYDANAPKPSRWLKFLAEIWGDDRESIEALQEWFGYLLTTDTSQQKMLLLIGPKRAGKGTIARVLKSLVGERNFVGPTLNSLTTEFGLAPLVGRSVALIDDARLSGRADSSIVTERLLSITGEGTTTVNRKHREEVSCKLSSRFVILTNELPRIADTSGALAGRVILLQLTRTFFSREDTTLTDTITANELPGILLWAIEGLQRLKVRGRFVQPGSGEDGIADLEDLGSPVGTFVKEECIVDPQAQYSTEELYRSWKAWCESTGRKEAGTVQVFGRDLKAVVSGLKIVQIMELGKRCRFYLGIRLRNESDDSRASIARDESNCTRVSPLHTLHEEEDSERCRAHNGFARVQCVQSRVDGELYP